MRLRLDLYQIYYRLNTDEYFEMISSKVGSEPAL